MFIIYYGFATWALCYDSGELVACFANEHDAENDQIKRGQILSIGCKVQYR